MRKGEKKEIVYDDSMLYGREHVLDAGVHLNISGHCFFELDRLAFFGLFWKSWQWVLHDMNSDCIPPCAAQEEILLENTRNNFDVDSGSPHASSSYIPPVSRELQSGSSFLTDLLHNHMSGIKASPYMC